MKNRLVLLLALFAMGCDMGEEAVQNSPATSRILDHFAGGLRFGDSFEAAVERGSLVDSHLDESGSTMRLLLRNAKHGLSSARLLGTANPSRDPASTQVYRVILFSRPDSAQAAVDGATEAARRIFGSPGEHGCIGYSVRGTSRVTVWEDELGGGVALIEPSLDSLSIDGALTRLVVYPRGRKANDALSEFRTANCEK